MSQPVASPSTRRYAAERGVDLAALSAELGHDVIARTDIDRKVAGTSGPKPAAGGTPWDVDHARYGPVEQVDVSRLNQVAAANLAVAQRDIPAVTHHDAADLTMVEDLRKRMAEEAKARSVKLTALAFHVKALGRALEDFPRFNASLAADGKTLWLRRYVDIAIAVDTPHGLMVPVIRRVARKGLWAIAAAIADLAARAQERRLRPDDMGGASMTISNLGGLGGRAFTPIVNPPEVAILGLTRARLEPVWSGGAFTPRLMCPIDLSYDHRALNGADAARFVTHYAHLIADPRRLLI
jgi:pyruvate/2-oxoglutarate dehydrogenase complex dihydrolipoamide acyltransferase (E2) component